MNQDYVVNVDLSQQPDGSIVQSATLQIQNVVAVDSFLTGPAGAAGPQGPKGDTGLTGATGANGAPGSVWYEGAGVPSTTHNDGDMYLNTTNGDVYQQSSGSWGSPVGNIKGPAGSGGGDVVGPASSTDNAIARFDGTTGKLIQNSVQASIDDNSIVTFGPTLGEVVDSFTRLGVNDDDGSHSDFAISTFGGSYPQLILAGANGTAASPTDTTVAAQVGSIAFRARQSGIWLSVASIDGLANGDVNISANGTVSVNNNTVVLRTNTLALTNKDLTSGTNTFPTFNQNTTGSAATLTTARTIGALTGDVTSTGSPFNGSANNTNSTTVTRINGTSLAGLATGILKNTTTTGVPSIAVAADFPTLNQNTTGSAATLTTGRTIGILTGDATSSGSSFNGSANNTNAVTLATVNSNVGTFTNATVTVNGKGLVTAVSSGSGASAITRNVSTIGTSVTIGSTALTDYVVFVNSGGAPTLPTAVGNTNLYTIKNIHTTNKTIATTSSQTIDGSTTVTLTPNTSLDIVSDGSNWRIV